MNVIVYSTNTWPWCVRVKDYLKQNNIEFKEFNVAEHHEAAMEMIQKTGQRAVPVIDVDGNIVIGFNKEKLDKLLGLQWLKKSPL